MTKTEFIDGLAHELWAAAQLPPGGCIVDGVDRIAAILAAASVTSTANRGIWDYEVQDSWGAWTARCSHLPPAEGQVFRNLRLRSPPTAEPAAPLAVPGEATTDQMIELTACLERVRARAIIEAVEKVAGENDPRTMKPYWSGWSSACEEVAHRFKTEAWGMLPNGGWGPTGAANEDDRPSPEFSELLRRALATASPTSVQGAPVAAEGWKLVPMDATDKMIAEAEKVDFSNEDTAGTLHNIWHTMLAAAPVLQPGALASQPVGSSKLEVMQMLPDTRAVQVLRSCLDRASDFGLTCAELLDAMRIVAAPVAATQQQAAPQAVPVAWRSLTDGEWVNIVNADSVKAQGRDVDGAVCEAFKLIESRLRQKNDRALATAPALHPDAQAWGLGILAKAEREAEFRRESRDYAFEAVRKRLCALPRHSFIVGPAGGVKRVEDKSGAWIEFDAAHAMFDPVAVDACIAAMAASKQEGGAA